MWSGSRWGQSETVQRTLAPTAPLRVIKVDVPVQMTERRIFAYAEVIQSSAANYLLKGFIKCLLAHNEEHRFPFDLSDFGTTPGSGPNESAISMFSAGGAPVGDSIVLSLFDPFDTTTPINKVTVQPLRLNAEITTVEYHIQAVSPGSNITGYRAFLGVLSAKSG